VEATATAAGNLGERRALAVGENADGSLTLDVMRTEGDSVLGLPGSRQRRRLAVANQHFTAAAAVT
jgi:hypothetical protein